MKKWITESSKYIHKSPYGNIRLDRCKLPNGEVIKDYCVNEFDDWIHVVAVNDDNELLLVKQYRQGIGDLSLEIVAGYVDPGETYEEAAIRELKEETGYICAEKPIFLGSFNFNPAKQNNKSIMFYTNKIKNSGEVQFDSTEELELVKIPFSEVDNYISNGSISSLSNVTAIMLAKEYIKNQNS